MENKYHKITIRIPKELDKLLILLAIDLKVAKSALIRRAIHYYLSINK